MFPKASDTVITYATLFGSPSIIHLNYICFLWILWHNRFIKNEIKPCLYVSSSSFLFTDLTFHVSFLFGTKKLQIGIFPVVLFLFNQSCNVIDKKYMYNYKQPPVNLVSQYADYYQNFSVHVLWQMSLFYWVIIIKKLGGTKLGE